MTRTRLIAAALLLFASTAAYSATDLAVICPDASYAGEPVAGTAAKPGCVGQVHGVPTSSSLVRTYPTLAGPANWGDLEHRWVPYGSLPAGSPVEGCATDIQPGPIEVGCLTWRYTAKAATAGAGSFTASKTSGTSPLATTLTWNIPGATSCTASGAWTGSKAAAGSQALTLTAGGTYSLACQVAGPPLPGVTVVTWTPVTQNTDGSPVTISSYRLYRGVGTAAMAILQTNINPTATTTSDPGLAPGTYRYHMTAVAGAVESGPSGEGSKVVPNTPTSAPWAASVAISVLPPATPSIPAAPIVTIQ